MKLPDVRCECPVPVPMANKTHCLHCGFQLPVGPAKVDALSVRRKP
jgi:hypothetical protein